MTILGLIEEAQEAGARLRPCCQVVGLDTRTVQRWRAGDIGDDGRFGPKTEPSNKLTSAERNRVLEIANSVEFRDKSPRQIVPILAERSTYIASESSFFRILRAEDQLAHRGRSKAPITRPVVEHRSDGPNQVWSWDITYLRSPIAGSFFYLYLFMDVWSRKIVASRVELFEDSGLAADLLERTCRSNALDPRGLVIHQDNGSPMKGATLKATMERLGVVASFSRPRVSDDNPYSESLFRTLKYRSTYPRKPFESIDAARAWVADFIAWYNQEHRHRGIGFVTPAARHEGRDEEILASRRRTYQLARQNNPERWSRHTRAWDAPKEVILNPSPETMLALSQNKAA